MNNRLPWTLGLVTCVAAGIALVVWSPDAAAPAAAAPTADESASTERLERAPRAIAALPGEPDVAAPDGPHSASEALAPSPERASREPVTETADPDTAVLRVLAVSADTGAPVSGLTVYLELADSPDLSSREVPGAILDGGGRPRTGDDGRVTIPLRAGAEYSLRLRGGRRSPDAQVLIEPLALGELRDRTIELRTDEDLHYFGLVVADQSELPIPGVEVRAKLPRLGEDGQRVGTSLRWQPVPVAADGSFDVLVASWWSPGLRLSAPGYIGQQIPIDAGHGDPTHRHVIRLVAESSLQVSVFDAQAQPAVAVDVRLSRVRQIAGMTVRTGLGEHDWAAETDVFGVAEFHGLPSDAPLELDLVRDGRLVFKPVDPVVLSPGELVELEFRLDSSIELHGIVVDQHEVPVAGLTVMARPAADTGMFFFLDDDSPSTKTDPEGRFVLTGLFPGSWKLGPPGNIRPGRKGRAAGVAASPVLVEIEPEPRRQEYRLEVSRGLFIRGTAVDGAGLPLAELEVSSHGAESFWTRSTTKQDGSFVLGPLPAGEHEVRGEPRERDGLAQTSVDARAGDSDVVLRMIRPARVRGTVRDRTSNEPVRAKVSVGAVRGLEGLARTGSSGRFELEDVEPGTHDLIATTLDGRFGLLANVEVGAGQSLENLDLFVDPGATLVVQYEGREGIWIAMVQQGDTFVAQPTNLLGRDREFTVPAGRLEITQLVADSAPKTQTVDLAPGERRIVILR